MTPAVIDTSAISSWFKLQRRGLNVFDLLPNLMPYALIPQKVVCEVEAHSPEMERPNDFQWFINNVGTNETSFFRLCTASDSVILQELIKLPKVDGGEAEAAAQSNKIAVNWLLIDDKKCLPQLQKVFPDFHFHNSLTLFSILEQTALLPNPEEAFAQLNKVYNYNTAQRRQAMQTAEQWLRLK